MRTQFIDDLLADLLQAVRFLITRVLKPTLALAKHTVFLPCVHSQCLHSRNLSLSLDNSLQYACQAKKENITMKIRFYTISTAKEGRGGGGQVSTLK